MKKFLTLLCMITCVFGLTACGSETLTDYEQQKVDYAQQLAVQKIVPVLASFMDESVLEAYNQYNAKDMEAVVQQEFQLYADGYAFMAGMKSFHSAASTVGVIQNVGEARAEIDGNQIIVSVDVVGEKKNAVAEVVFSNDLYMEMESAALNPTATFGEMMQRAALNTIIGMGTVFLVLILISFIISTFRFIPIIQARKAKKEEVAEVKTENTSVPAIPVMEEEIVDESDNLVLVAVIAAAIAASEGAASTEGFVVRSIRRVNRY